MPRRPLSTTAKKKVVHSQYQRALPDSGRHPDNLGTASPAIFFTYIRSGKLQGGDRKRNDVAGVTAPHPLISG
jgi:hypothetical protein